MTKVERLGLLDRLLELRREGKTLDECAQILSNESGHQVSRSAIARTLRNWDEQMREVRSDAFEEKLIEEGDKDWNRLEWLLDWTVGIVGGKVPKELESKYPEGLDLRVRMNAVRLAKDLVLAKYELGGRKVVVRHEGEGLEEVLKRLLGEAG